MRQRWFTMLGLTILVSAVGTVTLTDLTFGEPHTVEMTTTAKVSVHEAVKIASEQAPGTIFDTELKQKHDKLVWEVKQVILGRKVLEVHIDAQTGAVIDVKEGTARPTREPSETKQFRNRGERFPYGLCS